MAQRLLLYGCFLISVCSCTPAGKEYLELTYGTDMEEFTNPERGFYRPFGAMMSDFKPLDVKALLSLKEPSPAAGGFMVGSTLLYRSYQFDKFKQSPLDEEVLYHIQNDMDLIREAGMKVILRFSYSKSCCDPPFNDAPKETILEHLEQLEPTLKNNEDVIAVVQMGLIGPWGEQFYSDHFGDLEHGPVTNQHWTDRNEVISALLNVVPQSRMVQVRAPYYKLRYLEGEKAHPENAIALEEGEAFSGSAKARLAHHNDCILANYDDYWTYNSFHTWPATVDTLNLKAYVAKESKYLVFGGETCPGGPNGEDVYSPYNDCISEGGNAENYLKRFHTSFLNTSWSGAINGDWNNKCIEDIKRNLGYRFALKKGIFPKEIKNNERIKIRLEIVNEGYASTYNYRFAELVLRNMDGEKAYKKLIECDTRYWFPDEVQVLDMEFEWPEQLPEGDYALYLNLPDASPSLYSRPEYSIRLASTYQSRPVWDAATGWNLLFPGIRVLE
jgi:hypothetical protein